MVNLNQMLMSTTNLVAGVEWLEGVRTAELVAVLGKGGGVVGAAAHAAVPVADQGVGHHQGDVVGVGPPATLIKEFSIRCNKKIRNDS